jgi:hypothetical protein
VGIAGVEQRPDAGIWDDMKPNAARFTDLIGLSIARVGASLTWACYREVS